MRLARAQHSGLVSELTLPAIQQRLRIVAPGRFCNAAHSGASLMVIGPIVKASFPVDDKRYGYMGTADAPRLLRRIRPEAKRRWEEALARGKPPGEACRCEHTRIWHDFYHPRPDGEWVACWCASGDCGFKERCDVCECTDFSGGGREEGIP